MKILLKALLLTMNFSSFAFAAGENDLNDKFNKLNAQAVEQQNVLLQLQQQIKQLNENKVNDESPVSIGGYTEIIYNSYSNDSSKNKFDLRRLVLFVGKSINTKWSFNSEIEWEHSVASASSSGETAVEQAYLNYQYSDDISLKFGLVLMPFGFVNEAHEPPVFFGVERSEVENRIIPTTWREGGITISGSTEKNLNWGVGLVSGLNFAKFESAAKPLRALRQDLAEANARDLALFFNFGYQTPGFLIGTSFYNGDSGQGNATYKSDNTLPNFEGINNKVTLIEAHVRVEQNSWDIQALMAKGGFAQAEQINQILNAYNTANSTSLPFLPAEFYGWYTQVAYKFLLAENKTLSPFIRYEEIDSQANMPTGYLANPKNTDHISTIGLSYKPASQIVFKTDYQNYNENSSNNKFNLGLGYMF